MVGRNFSFTLDCDYKQAKRKMHMSTQKTSGLPQGLLTHLTLAGAAALAGSSANAQIVLTDVNVDVGFGPGGSVSFTSSLPGISEFSIGRIGSFSTHSHSIAIGRTEGGYMRFKGVSTRNDFLEITKSPPGAKWSSISGNTVAAARFAGVFSGQSTDGGHSTHNSGYRTFTDGYFAFEFQDATIPEQLDFGYIKASLTDDSFAGLNLHISDYAFDASGQEIAMGALPTGAPPASGVPEPSPALALAALSALSLGAIGVRRMKAIRAVRQEASRSV
jgi:hypothetical protein